MMKTIKKNFKIISVNKNITSSRIDHIIYPSELDKSWLKKNKRLKKKKFTKFYILEDLEKIRVFSH